MGALTKTFKSGNSVAVRLPKEFGIEPGIEVELENQGQSVVIRRKPRHTGRDLIEALAKLPRPRHVMKRERILAPKRHGL